MKRRLINSSLFTSPKQANVRWLCYLSTGLFALGLLRYVDRRGWPDPDGGDLP
jgi:hypothetical protein